jgi:uracil-DNA glycosylase
MELDTFIDDKLSRAPLHPSWYVRLKDEFEATYMTSLRSYLKGRIQQKALVFPEPSDWFAALHAVSFEDVKVVILGQDPYHGPGQAHGLCFSVREGVALPPSLVNIYKELKADLDIPAAKTGYLMPWAKQGVLLLNSVLTVEAGMAASHQGKGWETFTDAVIKLISDKKEHCVFLLWGNFAKSKLHLIDLEKHLVLTAAHPSPLAGGAFYGSKHFSKTNEYLISKQLEPINWALPSNTLF